MKQLIKSTAFLTASNLITRLTSFAFFILLAKMMTIEDYGTIRYLLAASTIYAVIFTGVPTALTRYLSIKKIPIKVLTTNAFLLMSALFILSIIAISIFEKHKIWMILLTFAILIYLFYIGFAQGILNYFKLASFKFIENVIQLILLAMVFLFFGALNLDIAIIFYSISPILSVTVFEVIKNEISSLTHPSIKIVKTLLPYALAVSVGAVGWTALVGINTIIIERSLGLKSVAIYSVGITLVQVFSFLPLAISTIVLPKASALNQKAKIIKPLSYAIAGTIFLSALILLALIMFKETVITLLFSSEYTESGSILIPLAVAQTSLGIHQIFASTWQGFGKPIVPTLSITSGAVFNLVISLTLVNTQGIIGAATSYAIASLIALVLIAGYTAIKWKTITRDSASS